VVQCNPIFEFKIAADLINDSLTHDLSVIDIRDLDLNRPGPVTRSQEPLGRIELLNISGC